MKSIILYVNNRQGSCWVRLEKKDELPFILPTGTIFEVVENYCGVVVNHYYDEKKSKFITNIEVDSVKHSQLKYFKEELLKNGWVIKFEDKKLML